MYVLLTFLTDIGHNSVHHRPNSSFLQRGEVTYNDEDDQHFASLNVSQTLRFALMTKTKKHEKQEVSILIDALLKMFGLSHTAKTC